MAQRRRRQLRGGREQAGPRRPSGARPCACPRASGSRRSCPRSGAGRPRPAGRRGCPSGRRRSASACAWCSRLGRERPSAAAAIEPQLTPVASTVASPITASSSGVPASVDPDAQRWRVSLSPGAGLQAGFGAHPQRERGDVDVGQRVEDRLQGRLQRWRCRRPRARRTLARSMFEGSIDCESSVKLRSTASVVAKRGAQHGERADPRGARQRGRAGLAARARVGGEALDRQQRAGGRDQRGQRGRRSTLPTPGTRARRRRQRGEVGHGQRGDRERDGELADAAPRWRPATAARCR